MRPATLIDLIELCAKHNILRPADTAGLRFENFGAFASTYANCNINASFLRCFTIENAERMENCPRKNDAFFN